MVNKQKNKNQFYAPQIIIKKTFKEGDFHMASLMSAPKQ